MEKVQREFIHRVNNRCRCNANTINLNYNNQPTYAQLLATYNIETLELRRLKICLNLFHQYLNGLIPIKTDAFRFIPSATRGESHKIAIQPATNDVRFFFFIRYARIYSDSTNNLKNRFWHWLIT